MDDRFTGGDGLKPGSFEHQLHQGLMVNELAGGHGAYRMANAVAAASGPSFGPFQYDLGGNARGRELIERIARTAVDGQGRRIIDDQELVTLRRVGYQPFRDMSSGERSAYLALKPQLDVALSSPQGRRAIDTDYVEHLREKVAEVDAVVAGVGNPRNRAFLENSPLARLIIADTRNQFGPSVNAGLQRFIGMDAADPAVRVPLRRRPETIAVDGTLGLEDLVRYKLETQYAQSQQGARDTLRRISNLVSAVGAGNIVVSREDREFFRTGLPAYLRGNGIDPGFLDREADFRPLRALGNVSRVAADAQPASSTSVVAASAGRTAQAAARPLPLADGMLRRGEHGEDVVALQRQLNADGIRDGHGRALPLTGNYLDRTQGAVATFQRIHGLEPTGIADPVTRAALARPAEVRYGHQGSAVTHVQQMLQAAGVDVPVSGRFNYQTEGAVKDFQLAQGLRPTGVVSDETLYRLRESEVRHAQAVAPRPLEAPASAAGAPAPPSAMGGVAPIDVPRSRPALFDQALGGMHALDAAHGRTPDARTANAAGMLALSAREAGLERIDHVVLGQDSKRLFAVQGEPDSPSRRIAWTDIVPAMAQPVEASLRRLESAPATSAPEAAALAKGATPEPAVVTRTL